MFVSERCRPPLPLLRCYYSVRSCSVFLRKGSYFISSFCLGLNASGALSAIFARFNSLLHPNKNIHPRLGPITHVGPRKIATSSIGLISLTRFWTAVSTGLSGSLSCIFHQAYRTLPVESPERERERPGWERPSLLSAGQKEAWNSTINYGLIFAYVLKSVYSFPTNLTGNFNMFSFK